jgi:adenine-specific DNA-methyltransferase
LTYQDTPLSRLQELFGRLFQLDAGDLDFGIYRLLRVKHAEVRAFIDEDLPASIDHAFVALGDAERDALDARMTGLARRIRDEVDEGAILDTGEVAPDFRKLPVKAARDLIAEYEDTRQRIEAVRTSDAQKAEVFNHLYQFFSRYYEDGDFVPRRRYGAREHYAVPYNGEETLLHWANRGQHYVKSGEVLRTYAFEAGGDLLSEPCQVEFRLTDADLPPGNTKGDQRYFFAAPEPVAWHPGERRLVVRFHFRPPTEKEAVSLGRTRIQDEITGADLIRVRDAIPDGGLRAALVPTDENEEEQGLLRRHLRRFVRRNTSDYFIHRDLRGFLERELEFYVKDQVLHLEDAGDDVRVRLRMIRVLRTLAERVIQFLTQIEDVQKRLFEKRKFVLRADYLVLISAVPRELWPQVLSNGRQIEEWKRLFHIGAEEDLFNPKGEVNAAFLERQPTLVVDTSLFDDAFKTDLLESFDDLDEATGGILVHSENYQALRLLEPRFRGQVRCIYIDPPYNTGSDDFLYKDRYQHSSWLSMMEERLRLGRALLSEEGFLACSIADHELPRLRLVADLVFGDSNLLSNFVWHNEGNIDNQSKVKTNHEYVVAFCRDLASFSHPEIVAPNVTQESKLFNERIENSITKNGPKNPPSTIELPSGFPATFEEGALESQQSSWPHRLDDLTVVGGHLANPARFYSGWSSGALLAEFIENGCQPITDDRGRTTWFALTHTGAIYSFKERTRQSHVLSILANVGTVKKTGNQLEAMGLSFDYPKPVDLVEYVGRWSNENDAFFLDFFAGSGTTAIASLRYSDAPGRLRRPICIDHSSTFDEVLVPRIVKFIYSPSWNDGVPISPRTQSTFLPLIKILRLESYEDALHNLASDQTLERETARAKATRGAVGEGEFRLRYVATLPLESSATMLHVDRLAHPDAYTLEVLTDKGPEERRVDLIETFNLLHGLRVRSLGRWINENDGGRVYRTVRGEDPDGKRTLVIWREMTDLDPQVERAFLESRIADEVPGFDVVLINGDSGVPGVRSLDPVFKARMEEEES